jgi:hypothetical protein
LNSETRRKTLEEIAAAFGDKVVEFTDPNNAEEILEKDSLREHIEGREAAKESV